jgi:hypothetical protein
MGWKEEKLIKNKGEKNLRRQGAGKTNPCLSARNSLKWVGAGKEPLKMNRDFSPSLSSLKWVEGR